MTTNRIIFFLSTLLFIPFFIVFFRYDYVPITDESYQLQAAKRLVEGRGLTSNLGANPFNDTEYQYLYQWPPGYSILIASLVHLGFSISSSAILIKTATILMGLYFWIKLSSHYLDSLAPKIIFMSITSFMVFTYNYLQTDLIIWSIFPIYSLYMLRLNDKKKRNGESLILIATCLVLFILFKFHTVVFYPITLAWLVYVFYSDLRKLISYSLAIMVPGVLTGLLIRDINLKLAHTTTDVVNINNFNLHGLINIRLLTEKLYIFLEYFFIRPLRLEFITMRLVELKY
jgi:hypothetical protein